MKALEWFQGIVSVLAVILIGFLLYTNENPPVVEAQAITTYNYTFRDSTNNKGYYIANEKIEQPALKANCWEVTNELTAANYIDLYTVNDSGPSVVGPSGSGYNPWIRFNFTLNGSVYGIQWMNVTMRQQNIDNSGTGEDCAYLIYNSSAATTWDRIGTDNADNAYVTRSKNFTSGFTDLVQGNQIVLLAEGGAHDSGEGCQVDYVQILIGYTPPPPFSVYISTALNNTYTHENISVEYNVTGSYASYNCTAYINSVANVSMIAMNNTNSFINLTKRPIGTDSVYISCMNFSVNTSGTISISPSDLFACQELSTDNRTYWLGSDFPVTAASCITLSSNNITLDCMGHSIIGTGAASNSAIYISSATRNNVVRNCSIKNWDIGILVGTSNNSQVYNNTFLNSTTYALSLSQGRNSSVYNNIILNTSGRMFHESNTGIYQHIFNNSGYGLSASVDVGDFCGTYALVENNTFYGINRGIIICSTTNNSMFRGNKLGNTALVQILSQTPAGYQNISFYNNLFNKTGVAYSNTEDSYVYLNTSIINEPRVFGSGMISGNYWTNETGTGYSDTCTDADANGFCDEGYSPLTGSTCSSGLCDYMPMSNKYSSTHPGIEANVTTCSGKTGIHFLNCSPQYETYPSQPDGQTASCNIINITNNGTATGDMMIALNQAAATGWKIYFDTTDNTPPGGTMITTTPQTMANLAAGATQQVWIYANCSFVQSNPQITFLFTAV